MVTHPMVTAPRGSPLYYAQIAMAAREVGKQARKRTAASTDPWANDLPVALSPFPNSAPLSDRIGARIRLAGPDECWLWMGSLDRSGYGKFTFKDQSIRAHRFMWEKENGPIPAGIFACHRCDTPRCCNPRHIFIGTPAANTRDSMLKGRHGSLKQAGKKRGPYRHCS